MPDSRTQSAIQWGAPLASTDPALRALFTGYLLVIGIGLLMSFAQILLTHGMADGEFGLSVDDIVYSYYGNREGSRIEAKLQGSMKLMASEQDRATIIKWVRKGAPRGEWDSQVRDVVAANCMRCHGTVPETSNILTGIKRNEISRVRIPTTNPLIMPPKVRANTISK